MLQGQSPGAAMKMSLIGTMKNILPGILFGLVAASMVVISILLLGLGLLVSVPVTFISVYAMCRDIFVAEE